MEYGDCGLIGPGKPVAVSEDFGTMTDVYVSEVHSCESFEEKPNG